MPNEASPGILASCPWIPGFRSDDLDEVRRFFGGISGSKARVAHDRRPMGLAAHSLMGRLTGLGSTASVVGQTVRWVVDRPVFQLSVPVGSVFRTGRQVCAPTGPNTVVMLPPDWEWTRTSPAGLVLALWVEPKALRDELRALRPSTRGDLAHRLVMQHLRPIDQARLLDAVAAVAQATRPGADPQQLKLAEARLLTQAASLIPDGPARPAPVDMSERRIRDLEDWIEANLGEPITLGALCQTAGVGARGLQRAFEHRRGVSPMRFVAERRLAATHRALLHAGPDASVTHIALANGFDHVGRFAHLYRQVLGELPSRTLAKPHRR